MPYKSREAMKAARHRSYLNNREKYKVNKRERKQRTRAWLHELKSQLVCNRCPESHPACLTFHHTDPSQKEIRVALAIRNWGLERIKKEIAKCEVLCSNCHLKHHWEERMLKFPLKLRVGVEPTTTSLQN